MLLLGTAEPDTEADITGQDDDGSGGAAAAAGNDLGGHLARPVDDLPDIHDLPRSDLLGLFFGALLGASVGLCAYCAIKGCKSEWNRMRSRRLVDQTVAEHAFSGGRVDSDFEELLGGTNARSDVAAQSAERGEGSAISTAISTAIGSGVGSEVGSEVGCEVGSGVGSGDSSGVGSGDSSAVGSGGGGGAGMGHLEMEGSAVVKPGGVTWSCGVVNPGGLHPVRQPTFRSGGRANAPPMVSLL